MNTYAVLRKQFRDFFEKHQHTLLPSSPLVPEDSTLLFTNSGMVQFKDYFAGKLTSKYSTVATIQKCVRAGGKHNDLDNVGYTNRHHTFFEMMGNFSFGNYFKEKAISLTWEFLTEVIKLDKKRLYITVYHTDDEAYKIWKHFVPAEQIIHISSNDNFWQVGNVGPCGPCSEIFYDYGSHIEGGKPGTADEGGARFTEIWNIVFMQNYLHEDGTITNLLQQNIDTGMGLERLASIVEGTIDSYSTSFFKQLIREISQITGIIPSKNLFTAEGDITKFTQEDIALRILSDHIRSICFLLADGVLPSNEGRGYVLRRIIRRALKSAYFAGVKQLFLSKIANVLIEQMDEEYNELAMAKNLILAQTKLEEEKFMELLPRGIKALEKGISENSQNGIISGEFAFKLYDTYGFPLDITLEIAKKYGINEVDKKTFEDEMNSQQARSKKSWNGTHTDELEGIKKAISHLQKTEFIGYTQTQYKAQVVYSKNGYAVFDKTPFYAESGGQISDTGTAGFINILDVQNIDGIFVHKVSEDIPYHEIDLIVNIERRKKISNNHTATHLLHHVLREQYGDALTQKGSLVKDDGFRFDFSHSKPITLEEIHNIELEVNKIITQNHQLQVKNCSQKEAIQQGAIALFGEKYKEKVRVVSFGKSIELCGGIHTPSTGEIGVLKITSQSAVASGVRRFEVKTGIEGIAFTQNFEKQIAEIKYKYKTSSSVMNLVEQKVNEINKLKVENQDLNTKLTLFVPIVTMQIAKIAVQIKTLQHFNGDIRQIANEIDGENVLILNQKGDNFSFCITSQNKAEEIAEFLKTTLDIKYGGSENCISGGGNGKVTVDIQNNTIY
ncbi:MAG: alanyl-tRNA synthetase [Candidatus Deianiraeaceae bacterium]|jgi:alanyl-tRNA synthetase